MDMIGAALNGLNVSRWAVYGGAALVAVGVIVGLYKITINDAEDRGALECVNEYNQADIDQLHQQIAALEADKQALRDEVARVSAILAQRDSALSGARSRADNLEDQLNDLIRNQPDVKKWADTDLPVDLADRVRKATAPGDNPDGN